MSVRDQADFIRVLVGALVTYHLLQTTNPSVVYHWIRGQADFKLLFLKQMCEISCQMLDMIAQPVFNNLSRELLLANQEKEDELGAVLDDLK